MLPHFIESNEAMVLDYYRQKLKNIQKHWIIQVSPPSSSTKFRIRIFKIISMGLDFWISSSSSVQLGNDLKSILSHKLKWVKRCENWLNITFLYSIYSFSPTEQLRESTTFSKIVQTWMYSINMTTEIHKWHKNVVFHMKNNTILTYSIFHAFCKLQCIRLI